MNDKEIELNRYDQRAEEFLKQENNYLNKIPLLVNEPYEHYFKIFEKFKNKKKLLEIGAGMGENTLRLVQMNFNVCSTDLSPNSVEVMKRRFRKFKNFSSKKADIENLPFDDCSFDLVCGAGSLSYGNNILVMEEIFRVLKPGGVVILIDSLNENLIYKLNRYFHYLRKKRSKSTLINMPDINLIEKYINKFGYGDVRFFGSLTWIYPLLRIFLPEKYISKFSNWFDIKINVKKSAFKFILILKKNFNDK